MKRYISSGFTPWKTRYQVHWVSPDGKDCLLGGSNDINKVNEMTMNQARSLFDSPWESKVRKLKFLDSLYVVDVETEEDAMSYEAEEYIDSLMSELESGMHQND